MRRSRAAVGLAFVAEIGCSDKTPPPPPVEIQLIAQIELDSTRTVEVIGLRRWTVEMIQDSLKKYVPTEGFDSDAAAANLRYYLKFADAAVTTNTVVFDDDEKTTITVAVREPQDSARVHYAAQELDTVARIAEWRPITAAIFGDSVGYLRSLVAGAHLDGPSRIVVDSSVKGRRFTHREGFEFESRTDSATARPALDRIAARTSERDFAMARATIDTSSSLPDRMAAVLILVNFASRDEAWHALLRAAIGHEQGADASLAQQALAGLGARFPRTVNWTPVTALIHDVLDGTGLFALAPLATALARSGASPEHAAAWLAGGGEMLAAYVESENAMVRDPAHKLLVALRGQDLGFELAAWRQWIGTLVRSPRDSTR